MKDSWAKVFCKRKGERRGPVKNGDFTVWASTRSLRIEPVPPHFPLMHPATYEGTALLPLRSSPVGSVAGFGVTVSGSKPASIPVITFPGLSYPGLPPKDTAQVSLSHAMIAPLRSTPARSWITHADP